MIRLTRGDLMARAFPVVIAVAGIAAGVAGGVGLQLASPESAVGLLVSVATVNSAPVLIPLLGLCGRRLWHPRPRTATAALVGLFAAIGGVAMGSWAISAGRAFRLGLAPPIGLGDAEILAGIGLIPTAAIGGWTIGGHAKRWQTVSGFGFGGGGCCRRNVMDSIRPGPSDSITSGHRAPVGAVGLAGVAVTK